MTAPIVVLGGGPAGSTAATLLARQGWDVVLLERERFPREHVGESLLPASIPILETLGVIEQVEAAGFTPKYGATMVWGRDDAPWSWHFQETNERYPHAYQVLRPQFDQILLENSRRAGVEVREGWRALDVRFEGEQAAAVVCRPESMSAGEGAEQTIEAAWVVDATGQAGLIGRRLALRETDEFFRNLAVYSYFRGARRLEGGDAGNIFIEAFEHGWSWAIPLPDDVMSVGVVVDAAWGAERLAEAPPEQFLERQLASAAHTREMLASASRVEPARVVRDWSYVSQRLVGEGYILVGDAACFVDPLFSSGVHLALSSAVLSSAYVTSALRTPEMRGPAAEVYTQLYMQQYRQFREMAALFYASNRSADSYFWEARRLVGGGDGTGGGATAREAFIAAVAGQPPQGYERVVLERGEAPPDFVEGVAAVERERAERERAAAALIDRQWPDRSPLLELTPMLAEGVELERKPVVGEGQFEWGAVVSSPSRPQGAPISLVVARLVQGIDGRQTAREVIEAMLEGVSEQQRAQLLPGLLTALRVLYVDGMIAEFGGRDRSPPKSPPA